MLASQARGHLALMASPRWAKDHFPGASGPILPEASFQSVMEKAQSSKDMPFALGSYLVVHGSTL